MTQFRRWLSYARCGLLRIAAVAVVCRLLTPVGFMPGAIADGHVFVLCHSTTLGVMLAKQGGDMSMAHGHSSSQHAAGSMHGMPNAPDDQDAHSDAWENCPLGVTAHDLGPVSESTLIFAFESPPAPTETRYAEPASAPIAHFRSRAPPQHKSHMSFI
jgi:hypothetical protein